MSSQACTIGLTTQFVVTFVLLRARRVSGSLAPLRSKCAKMALRSYVCPESTTITGSRNMVRVMGHISSSGSASRSASGASGRSPRALAERRVCTPALAFSAPGCDAADVLRRFEGAIERTLGVAARPALGTLMDLKKFEILESAFLRHGTKLEER